MTKLKTKLKAYREVEGRLPNSNKKFLVYLVNMMKEIWNSLFGEGKTSPQGERKIT